MTPPNSPPQRPWNIIGEICYPFCCGSPELPQFDVTEQSSPPIDPSVSDSQTSYTETVAETPTIQIPQSQPKTFLRAQRDPHDGW